MVDCVPETVDEALAAGADLIVAHHPLLLKPVSSIAPDTYKGRIIHRLIRADVALYVAHTNADVANPGVSDALAARLDLGRSAPGRWCPAEDGRGIGRIGELAEPMPLAEFTAFAAPAPARHRRRGARGRRPGADRSGPSRSAAAPATRSSADAARCRRGRVPLCRPASSPGQRAPRRGRPGAARRRALGERAPVARRGRGLAARRSSPSRSSCPISTPTPGPCTP